jgi:predicted transcriptional regulator
MIRDILFRKSAYLLLVFNKDKPTKRAILRHETGCECSILHNRLQFLVKLKLIQKKKRGYYSLTKKGLIMRERLDGII